MGEWLNKMQYVYTTEYYSANKKEQITYKFDT